MGTQVEVNGQVVCKRMWGGQARGCVVQMNVTRSEWDAVKFQQAEVEGHWGAVVTAAAQVRAWEEEGATVVWNTAADWNAQAREFEQSRFAPMFDGMAAQDRERAREVARESMRVV